MDQASLKDVFRAREEPPSPVTAEGISAQRKATSGFVIETNSHSIVSKRSVERLYYEMPHFFRYFTKSTKKGRRAPLINRGYWLRMHSVEYVVKEFLGQITAEKKVVINLGCGYDVLPFQMLAKEPEKCRNAVFVDVDYPELMRKKADIINEEPKLRDLLGVGGLDRPETGFLHSENYIAIGCDLYDLPTLKQALSEEFTGQQCMFLLVAEVSITYMETPNADALIAWAACLGDVTFCLLEQILPNGGKHPFTITMLDHFEKQNSPLKSIYQYPQLKDQEARFTSAGWSSVKARSLWDVWNDDLILSPRARTAMNAIEPFDEWEDFAVFASHYFLLMARNTGKATLSTGLSMPTPVVETASRCRMDDAHHLRYGKSKDGIRRYGALFQTQGCVFAHHGGYGDQTRVNTTTIYLQDGGSQSPEFQAPSNIAPRMCHTVTNLKHEFDCLLVGGRSSPRDALGDCWLKREVGWIKVDDLPRPLYRHSATRVFDAGRQSGVLVHGGRTTNGVVVNDWLLWQESSGWAELECDRLDRLEPRFGAAMCADDCGTRGILVGGMLQDGTIPADSFAWALDWQQTPVRISIVRASIEESDVARDVYRFGATLTRAPTCFLLAGGISRTGLIKNRHDVVRLSWGNMDGRLACLATEPVAESSRTQSGHHDSPPNAHQAALRIPLFLGHSAIWDGRSLAIVGGGANCFSFGTVANVGVWKYQIDAAIPATEWRVLVASDASKQEHSANGESLPKRRVIGSGSQAERTWKSLGQVRKVQLTDHGEFERLVRATVPCPAVFEQLDIGECVTRWTADYLKQKIGPNRIVTVHESSSPSMMFTRKNFTYVNKRFVDLMDSVAHGGREYLRSTAATAPLATAANLAADFPEIASDFALPSTLRFATDRFHSSVLRISGPVNMWLHYDVMANVLCQVRGTKRLVLYPPSDVRALGIPPGGSSSAINVFEPSERQRSRLAQTHAREAVLRPGDVLFIPPLWCHAASPADGASIAVNVFFRDLGDGYAAGKDVYANRDVQAYADGRRAIARLVAKFDGLPPAMARFYLERLGDELRERAPAGGPGHGWCDS